MWRKTVEYAVTSSKLEHVYVHKVKKRLGKVTSISSTETRNTI